LDNDLII